MELIPPVSTNSEDSDNSGTGFIPILVIRRTRLPSFSSGFDQFPFFGINDRSDAEDFPFDTSIFGNDEEIIPDSRDEFPNIFSTILGDETEDKPLCGFLCSFLTNFEKKLKVLTDEVKTLHDMAEENEDDREFDVNNSTYTEKVGTF